MTKDNELSAHEAILKLNEDFAYCREKAKEDRGGEQCPIDQFPLNELNDLIEHFEEIRSNEKDFSG